MNRARIFILSLGLWWFGTGCFTRSTVEDGLGVASPDGKLRCAVTARGALGHEYINQTGKTFWVWIGSGHGDEAVTLLRQHYQIDGSDVEWRTRWLSNEQVAIDFFDYGSGVSRYDERPAGAGTNFLRTLAFERLQPGGKFKEKP